MNPNQYISIPQLAKILGISRIAVYKKVKKGIIKGAKVGRNYVVSPDCLPPDISKKDFSSIPELAKSLNISRVAVYKQVQKGIVQGDKVGRNFVVSKECLKEQRQAKNYISIPELAAKLNISRIAVYKKVKNGQIKAEKFGRNYRIHRSEIK